MCRTGLNRSRLLYVRTDTPYRNNLNKTKPNHMRGTTHKTCADTTDTILHIPLS